MVRLLKRLFEKIKKYPYLFLIFIFCIISSTTIILSTFPIQQKHYNYLARSFINGRLDLPISASDLNNWFDIAFFKNQYFVFFNPLPALFLVPFELIFKDAVPQHAIGLSLGILDLFFIYKIAKIKLGNEENAIWLSFFFVFGSIFGFLTLINTTAYQVQIIAVSFLIFALYEFFSKRRWLLIGILLASAGATRGTIYLAAVFFLIEAIRPIRSNIKFKNISLLMIPIIISIILLGIYNFMRFGSFLETGYSYADSLGTEFKYVSSSGFFAAKYIPGNLYLLLFKGPAPVRQNESNFLLQPPYLKADRLGMGIFFTSPLFLYIFLSKLKNPYIISSWITILVMSVPVLTYFGMGGHQYGFRYAFDFYPFLFLILLSVFKTGLPATAKTLIIYSIIFNFYFMLSTWNVYPFWIN